MVGILASRMLNNINLIRNLMEHDFIGPEEEQVSNFIDIVALFLASTDIYMTSHLIVELKVTI